MPRVLSGVVWWPTYIFHEDPCLSYDAFMMRINSDGYWRGSVEKTLTETLDGTLAGSLTESLTETLVDGIMTYYNWITGRVEDVSHG